MLAFARNSLPHLGTYNSTSALPDGALAGAFAFPPVWEVWRVLSGRFGVDTRRPPTKPLPVAHRFTLHGWLQPCELSVLSFTEIHARPSVLPGPAVSTDLWKAVALSYSPTAGGAELSLLGVSRDAEAIAARVRAESLQSSTDTPDATKAALESPIQADFLRL